MERPVGNRVSVRGRVVWDPPPGCYTHARLGNDDAAGLDGALDNAAGAGPTLGGGGAGIAGLIAGAEEAGLVVGRRRDAAGPLHPGIGAALVAGGATVLGGIRQLRLLGLLDGAGVVVVVAGCCTGGTVVPPFRPCRPSATLLLLGGEAGVVGAALALGRGIGGDRGAEDPGGQRGGQEAIAWRRGSRRPRVRASVSNEASTADAESVRCRGP